MCKIMHKRQKGFTLLEFLLAFLIVAIILPGIILLTREITTLNQRNINRVNAINQLKNAVSYLTSDTQMTGSVVTTSDNFPLSLSWISYPSDQIRVTYSLANGILTRIPF